MCAGIRGRRRTGADTTEAHRPKYLQCAGKMFYPGHRSCTAAYSFRVQTVCAVRCRPNLGENGRSRLSVQGKIISNLTYYGIHIIRTFFQAERYQLTHILIIAVYKINESMRSTPWACLRALSHLVLTPSILLPFQSKSIKII